MITYEKSLLSSVSVKIWRLGWSKLLQPQAKVLLNSDSRYHALWCIHRQYLHHLNWFLAEHFIPFAFYPISGLEHLFRRNSACSTCFEGHELWWTEQGWEEWMCASPSLDVSSSLRGIHVAPVCGATTSGSQMREWKQHCAKGYLKSRRCREKGRGSQGLWGLMACNLLHSLSIFAISVDEVTRALWV